MAQFPGRGHGPHDTSVLIVGGGPVGLTLAVELGWRGIDCVLVERTDGIVTSPRMNEVNIRSMEFCRRWGIAEKVRNCPFPDDHPMDVVFVTSMAGYELGRVPRPARRAQKAGTNSPEHLQVCSQFWFDPIMRDCASTFPTVSLRYRSRMTAFEENTNAVVATIHDEANRHEYTIRATFLVACDGASSGVREKLKISAQGDPAMGRPINLFFRAPDLLQRCDRAPGVFFLAIDREGLWANIRVIDPNNDLWRIMILDTPEGLDVQNLDLGSIARRAIGRDWPVEWVAVSPWTRRGVVAERYRAGRVFLAGDAAHQLSPSGGFGMNTGIGDAVDLGWKLAATLDGWGGPSLLNSYEHERRGVGLRNVGTTTEFHNEHLDFDGFFDVDAPTPAGARLREEMGAKLVSLIGRMFRTEGLQIGYRYDDSPICIPDGSPPTPLDPEVYCPTARPGARAPHTWLQDGRSTLDLFGRGFILMNFGADRESIERLKNAGRSRRLPFHIARIDDPAVAALYEKNLVLVRPDGHVAWRDNELGTLDPEAMMDRVRGI